MRFEAEDSLGRLIRYFRQGLSISYDALAVDARAAGRREERRTEGGIIKGDESPAFTSHKLIKSLLYLDLSLFAQSQDVDESKPA